MKMKNPRACRATIEPYIPMTRRRSVGLKAAKDTRSIFFALICGEATRAMGVPPVRRLDTSCHKCEVDAITRKSPSEPLSRLLGQVTEPFAPPAGEAHPLGVRTHARGPGGPFSG